MKFHRNQAIINFLEKHEDQKFTAYQIADHLVTTYPERPGIDWDMANRLCKENPDFASFIQKVIDFYKTGNLDIFKNG